MRLEGREGRALKHDTGAGNVQVTKTLTTS
jgi:hypothetical protein